MATRTASTIDNQKAFAKGRIRKWTRTLEVKEGACFRLEDVTFVNDPEGFTAELVNGSTVLAYGNDRSSWRRRLRFAVVGADGKYQGDYGSVSTAIGKAMGQHREFRPGHSSVTLSVVHNSTRNRLKLVVHIATPNPDQVWVGSEANRFASLETHNVEAIKLAVGLMATPGGPPVEPLLDCLAEEHWERLERVMSSLHAEPVPAERLWKSEHDFTDGKYLWRAVNATTGEPVEGPEGQWH